MVPSAYGIGIHGSLVGSICRNLVSSDDVWAEVGISRMSSSRISAPEVLEIGADEARVGIFPSGMLHVNRSHATAIFDVQLPFDEDDIVHPGLASIAAVYAYWHGLDALHAGSFVANGGAWGVLAFSQRGKSTTLALLHAAGFPIIAEDLMILRRQTALCGPRVIDLRPDVALHFEADFDLRPVRGGRRLRIDLPRQHEKAALAGWIFLEDGDEVVSSALPAGETLRRLFAHRAYPVMPPDAQRFLDFAALPAWSLRRPRQWAANAATLRELGKILRGRT